MRGCERCRPTSHPSSLPPIRKQCVLGEDPAHLRALRLLHRHLPDLSAARRRTRQPARPHLPDQGHAGKRQARPPPRWSSIIDRCLSCLACMTTCPSGVHYMHLVDHARAHIEETYTRSWHDRLMRKVLAMILPYPGRFRLAIEARRDDRQSLSALLGKLPSRRSPHRPRCLSSLPPRSPPRSDRRAGTSYAVPGTRGQEARRHAHRLRPARARSR
jgi:ferredoxin